MTKTKRLLDSFVPKHYDVSFDLTSPDTFSGKVTINGRLNKESTAITLHSKGLNIVSASVNGSVAKTSELADDQAIILAVEKPVSGDLEIEIAFNAEITQTMEGIYQSKYQQDDLEKTLISTQFESHHAREAFPCIDEPAAKATFDLTITANDGLVILGNTPVKSESKNNGHTTVSFETTPIMSCYLLAFVVGELEFIEAKTKDGTLVRTYATPHHKESLQFSLDVAVKCLDFYADYFKIPYPLEKCDMVAIPEFASGAMENWGLITYRESAMLVDPKNSSVDTKTWVALVVAHELAHQWFGNLVTMAWWDDLWLNEGFASWVEYLAVAEIFPDWDMWTQFVSQDYLAGMKLDSLANSHPIQMRVDDPRAINEIFDHITYRKGASVIRQLHSFMGPKDFQTGLIAYLEKHKYGNAETEDLWQALDAATDKDVTTFMHAWTSQTGYPVVRVSDDKVSQERFVISPLERENIEQNLWPIDMRNDENEDQFFFDSESADGHGLSKTAKLNAGQAGFYRVAYSTEQLSEISKKIADGSLPTADVMGVLNDAFELAKAGYGSTTNAISLLPSISTHDHASIWDIVSIQLGGIFAVFGSDELKESVKPFGRKLIGHQYDRLGWVAKKDEPHFDTLLRSTILGFASRFDHADARTTAIALFKDRDTTPINPDIRDIVYLTVARDGDKATFDAMLEMHNATNLAEEKSRLQSALTHFKQPELIQRAVDLIRSESVRTQDVISWMFGLYGNRYARDAIWQWQKDNWTWIEETFGEGHLFSYFVQGFARYSDAKKADEIESFFKTKKLVGVERSLAQSLEQIRWQADWKDRDLEAITKFFNQ